MVDQVAELLRLQSGVVARAQLLEAGLAPHDVRRMLRRRELVPLHEAVYLAHTGDPTWLQRAWAAVLYAAPAALAGASAVRAADGPGRAGWCDEPIHVAVDRKRTLAPPSGVLIQRVSHLASRSLWTASPPRLRLEEALLDVAAAAGTDHAAIATLADGVQSRRTTAGRLGAALQQRERIARRTFLAGVVDDLALGTCSVLEHGYLHRVERAHGLPQAARQVRASARGPVYRDVDYAPVPLLVELDGRLFHDSARARGRDLQRDLAALVEAGATARVGWSMVFEHACWTAAQVGELLTQRGWRGRLRRCPRCPPS